MLNLWLSQLDLGGGGELMFFNPSVAGSDLLLCHKVVCVGNEKEWESLSSLVICACRILGHG